MAENDMMLNEDLAYIKYSAKELLFHQAQQLSALQSALSDLKLASDLAFADMKLSMTKELFAINLVFEKFVTREEMDEYRATLIATRRWVFGMIIASATTGLAFLRFVGF